MNIAKPLIAVALASLSLTACAGTSGEEETAVGTATEASQGNHGGTCHGALTYNALTYNALTYNALTYNALTYNALTYNALKDPNARELLSYIVSCALPADQGVDITIEGVHYSYEGGLGLAPEWGKKNGSCDHDCQEWVSACLLSRVDYLGKEVEISVRGENHALQSCPDERAAYSKIEATYFGNVFHTPQLRYACLPPGATNIPRVCGPSLNGCVVDVVGKCEDVCGKRRPDGGYYPDCEVPSANNSCHSGVEYEGSITVYLKP